MATLRESLDKEQYLKEAFLDPQKNNLDELLESPKPCRTNGDDIIITAWNLARNIRNDPRLLDDPAAQAALLSVRKVNYEMAKLCTEELVKTLKNNPYRYSKAYIKEFWVLYSGEMTVVECSEVEEAMVDLGRQLDNVHASVVAADDLPPGLRDTDWTSSTSRDYIFKFNELEEKTMPGSPIIKELTNYLMTKRVSQDDKGSIALQRLEESKQKLHAALDNDLAKDKIVPYLKRTQKK